MSCTESWDMSGVVRRYVILARMLIVGSFKVNLNINQAITITVSMDITQCKTNDESVKLLIFHGILSKICSEPQSPQRTSSRKNFMSFLFINL